MRTVILDITPEMAKEMWQKRNPENRLIRKRVVSTYANVMAKGEWQLNAEGISFYENGKLRDGHHRILAIIESGATVRMQVTYGVPNESFICDRGLARSAGDILKMSGRGDLSSNYVAGTINFLVGTLQQKWIKANDATILDFTEDWGDTVKLAADIAASGATNAIGKKSSISAAIFCALICGVDEKVLRRFATVLNTGFADNPAEYPAIVVRNMLPTFAAGGQERIRLFNVATRAIEDFRYCRPRKKAYDKNGEPEYYKRVKAQILDKYA